MTIVIPMKNVAVSKVNISLADVYMKVNVPQNKLVLVFDLLHPIVYTSPKNRVQMLQDGLELFLVKEKAEMWPQLLHVDGKDALKKRREEALAREKKDADERAKIVAKRKIELDKHTVSEQMALEEAQRKAIHTRKEEEKVKAEQDVYATLEHIDHPHFVSGPDPDKEAVIGTVSHALSPPTATATKETSTKSEPQPKPPLVQELLPYPYQTQHRQRGADAKAEAEAELEQSVSGGVERSRKEGGKVGDAIFTENDVKEYEKQVRDAPRVREKATIKLGFTERKYPNLAAREIYLKEPPLPKAAQQAKKDNVYHGHNCRV